MSLRCKICRKAVRVSKTGKIFCCGVQINAPEELARIGERKAKICRSNECGFCDIESDSCLKAVEIARSKGQEKTGSISYLYTHPETKCPVGLF